MEDSEIIKHSFSEVFGAGWDTFASERMQVSRQIKQDSLPDVSHWKSDEVREGEGLGVDDC